MERQFPRCGVPPPWFECSVGGKPGHWGRFPGAGVRRILTAFLPWTRHALHVLHSMHCHLKAFTFAVNSGQNFKQDGCPAIKSNCSNVNSVLVFLFKKSFFLTLKKLFLFLKISFIQSLAGANQ